MRVGRDRSAPTSPWAMRMTWHDLLFAHWPIPPEAIAPLLPAPLEPDTFDGTAWLGIVPFRMSSVRPRIVPTGPLGAFPELNVRTYARVRGRPDLPAGVWFLSLDAASALAVAGARAAFGLPYFRARIATARRGDVVSYDARRTHRGAPPAVLRATYGATGPAERATPGSLEAFLVERYRLFVPRGPGGLARLEIDHEPWDLRPAELDLEAETYAAAHGITLPATPPHLLFADRRDVVGWLPAPLES